jgi:hypothetical protein
MKTVRLTMAQALTARNALAGSDGKLDPSMAVNRKVL